MVLVGFRVAVGGIARLEAALANALPGTSVHAPIASRGRRGFLGAAANVLGDGSFWRQKVFLLQRFVLGGTLAIAEVSLLGGGVWAIGMPIYYRWTNADIGSWHVDTLGRSLLWVPAGIAAVALALVLLRPLAARCRGLVPLLGGAGGEAPLRSPAAARAWRRRSLLVHAAGFAAVSGLLVLIWLLTSRSYFWPDRGYFWPMWPLLALALLAHAPVAFARRITELETSRAGRCRPAGVGAAPDRARSPRRRDHRGVLAVLAYLRSSSL